MFKIILTINTTMQQLLWNSGQRAIKVRITIRMYISKSLNTHIEKHKRGLRSDGFDEEFANTWNFSL